jgi:hypothetical protein
LRSCARSVLAPLATSRNTLPAPGSVQGGDLCRHALAVRGYPRIPVDHALLMAVTYAKENAKDINGRKTLHKS